MKRRLLVTACVLFGFGGIAVASTAWWYHHNFHAAPFKPVQLSQPEQQALESKVGALQTGGARPPVTDPAKTLVLSEREINGWLQQQGLGDHLKVSIQGGVIGATALLPLPGDVPIFGGQTVRFKIAVRTQFDARRHLGLVVSDITVGGISPPNAWLGGIKGRDLLAEAGSDPLMQGLADGIRSVDIGSGEIRVLLND